MNIHYQIAIIGAGTAGIMVAAQLRKKDNSINIVLIDPAETHYYQPAWTLVGGGAYDFKKTARPMRGLIPEGVEWLQDAVTVMDPENNQLETQKGTQITYDYLVVAPGLVNDLSLIDGLKEAIEKGVVCSNYIDPDYTWSCLQKFKGGVALFTQPSTPIKCGGAPQKIMYLAADYLRKQKIADKSTLIFATPGSVIFGVPQIAKTLTQVMQRYKVDFKPFHNPVRIDSDKRIAYFVNKSPVAEGGPTEETVAISFDFLHLAPPQTAPKFIKESTLVNETGWLDVDHNSLKHNRYPNIFGLGDVAALPTGKTGAAIRKQVPVVVDNLQRLIKGDTSENKSYEGYSSCPLVTGYGKMVLAEFNYKNEFTPDPKLKQMFITDSSKEHWRLWLLKKYMLPYMYWNKMMKGEEV